ncbi:MAG: MarR family transcriptional regulator, partial [Lachnospiraceae bacterium]|nr:MarR family transcriptional regulator [Lachnospiraceae bacterium]
MENRIFMHLLQINRLLEYNFGENLKKWGLTFSQAHVLKTLYVNQGQATQKEIEKQLGVSHPTVSGLIHRLEKNGYVTSEIDKRDKRNRIVTLTDRAMEHRALVMEGRKKIENLLL